MPGTSTASSPDAWAARLVAAVATGLLAAADPDRAPAMQAYMKGVGPFLGVSGPDRDAALRDALVATGRPDHDDLVAAVEALWARPEREYRYVGCRLLRRYGKVLEPADLGLLERCLTTDPWWDTVDELAQHPVGDLVRRHPELGAVMDTWIDADNLWLARTAILHQNRWKDATDAARLFRHCARRAGDADFFLRKAIGWALRVYADTDPDAVDSFVTAHEHELSALSIKEARRGVERARTRAAGAR